jgi:hydrogenase maturation protease
MRRVEPNLTLVIGIGNEYRHDDGVGLIVARSVKAFARDRIPVIEASGEGAALLEAWRERDRVFLVDAVSSRARAGTIYRLDAHQQSVPTEFFRYSTHAFNLAEAIELARTLQQLPNSLIVYGIEGENFTAGEGLSPTVLRSAEKVKTRILEELCLK